MTINELAQILSDEGFKNCGKPKTESWTCANYVGNEIYGVNIDLDYNSNKLIYGIDRSIPIDYVSDIKFDKINYSILIGIDYIDVLSIHRVGFIKIPAIMYNIS